MFENLTRFTVFSNLRLGVYTSYAHETNNQSLKELQHRKLGWKYDLDKSLSKEMWCKMADTKQNFDCIFLKDEKCMYYEVNPFCVRGQENDFPSSWMVYWKCPGLCTFVLKNYHMVLFMLCYAVIWTFRDSLDFFPC